MSNQWEVIEDRLKEANILLEEAGHPMRLGYQSYGYRIFLYWHLPDKGNFAIERTASDTITFPEMKTRLSAFIAGLYIAKGEITSI